MTDLLSIGRFAQLSGLTVRAVRHYGELGLLSPAWVDDETGYETVVQYPVVPETARAFRARAAAVSR